MKPCVLHVKDEVNVKIEGLDLDTRRKLSNRFKYDIPGARYMPAVRLGRWDGKVAFFQMLSFHGLTSIQPQGNLLCCVTIR